MEHIEAGKTELFWLYRELKNEERKMYYDLNTNKQLKDYSQIYKNHMLAGNGLSDKK